MIKVCHVTSVHKSQDVRILKKQCTSLASEGYDVYLVAPGESYEENGVKVIGVGENTGGRIKRMTQMKKRVYKKALELDCDIYQLHDPELLGSAAKLKKKGKKVIFDSHEDYYLVITLKKYIPAIIRKPAAKIYKMYSKHVFRKIDCVIFPCLKDGKHIFENQCKNTVTIGNEPQINEKASCAERDFSNNTICYVGALTHTRGVSHLIKAAKKADAKLILAGTFSPKEFEKQLRETEEFSCVDFRGPYNRSELNDILCESSVGMATLLNVGQYNYYDNFATKIYEYMEMGLPCIISDYNFARKVNEKYDFAVLVDPEDIDEMSDAIKYLTENPERAKEMGQNGRRAVLEEFNWKNEEKKLFRLYSELSENIDCLQTKQRV